MLDDTQDSYLHHRAAQFREQVAMRVSGALTEDEFKPLRLMNGLYLQLHAYMLRVAIPYGTLNAAQLEALADISERWDRGYGHFTTRQNIQFNWPVLADVPDMLDALADVGLHAIQTSGNTVRNVTADHLAGAAKGEVADPRPYAELLRLWSTDHPEFQFLPRKFKIAVTGSPEDRAVTAAHDIGLRLVERDGEIGFQVLVGGGLGRTPMLGKIISAFVSEADLLPYVEAIVSVYNLLGRRDNKYKARIKIAVHEHGIGAVQAMVEERFAEIRPTFSGVDQAVLTELKERFVPPAPAGAAEGAPALGAYRSWLDTNVTDHRDPTRAIVTVSLKAHGEVPGDATAAQMRVVADLARRYGADEIRVSHMQNLVLPHAARSDLPAIYEALKVAGLATANLNLASDIIACPGMDYCALATARSIPVAQQIARAVEAARIEHDLGPLSVKISGCINACGHHHVGDIGILGLEKAGVESYQVTLGGRPGIDAAIGQRMGPGFAHDEIVPAVMRLLHAQLRLRDEGETMAETVRRIGIAPYKAALYEEVRDAA